jgi:hypothetical protein
MRRRPADLCETNQSRLRLGKPARNSQLDSRCPVAEYLGLWRLASSCHSASSFFVSLISHGRLYLQNFALDSCTLSAARGIACPRHYGDEAGAATMVNVMLDDAVGQLVACAVTVTVFPFGIAEGAVYVVMTSVVGYVGTGPERV